MAKIVISNAIANIAELKSRLRGVKTPGKRILAAAFKNNDYSALIGELLTRIELYQSVGVLDYKLKDVDTIQNMKFKFGFESVLASTLKASGVSSSPRVVQQIVRQQQVMAPVSFQNVTNNRPSQAALAAATNTVIYYSDIVADNSEADTQSFFDLFTSNLSDSEALRVISETIVRINSTDDAEEAVDRSAKIALKTAKIPVTPESVRYMTDAFITIFNEVGINVVKLSDASISKKVPFQTRMQQLVGQSDADRMIDEWTTVISNEDANVQKTWAQLVSLIPAEGIFAIVSQAVDFAMDASEPSDALYDGASDLMNTDGFTPSLRLKGNTIDNIYLCLHAIYLSVME